MAREFVSGHLLQKDQNASPKCRVIRECVGFTCASKLGAGTGGGCLGWRELFEMKIISLGAGVQSTTLYLMSSVGDLPRADHAIFADPGAEHPETYKLLGWLRAWQEKHGGIPIHHLRDKNLYADLVNRTNSTGQRFAPVPAVTAGGNGRLRRQCTKEYKIEPIIRKIREIYGLRPRQRMKETEIWLGISLDEIERMKESRLPSIQYQYPLIEKEMTRGGCMKWLRRHGFPVPVKSSCVFCPYQSDARWKHLKLNHPQQWDKDVLVDRPIRDSSKRGVNDPIFLHRSGIPLETVVFGNQLDLFTEECEEGYCGI